MKGNLCLFLSVILIVFLVFAVLPKNTDLNVYASDAITFHCPDTLILPPVGKTSSVECYAYMGDSKAEVTLKGGEKYVSVFGERLALYGGELKEKLSVELSATIDGVTAKKTVTIIPPIADNFDELQPNEKPVASNSAYRWDSSLLYNAQKSSDGGMYISASAGNPNYNGRLYLTEPVDSSYGETVSIEFSAGMYYGSNITGGIVGGLMNHGAAGTNYENKAFLAGVTSDFINRQTRQYNFYTLYNENGEGSLTNKTEFVLEDAELDKFFVFRYNVNTVKKTYDLYVDGKLVINQYPMNKDATDFKIESILWQSNFDDVAVYSGEPESASETGLAENIIAPPNGITAKIPCVPTEGMSLIDINSDYDIRLDGSYLYITGNGSDKNSIASFRFSGKNVPFVKQINIKAAVCEDFDSYDSGTSAVGFSSADSYEWMPSRANVSAHNNNIQNKFLSASAGRYSGFLKLKEAIDSNYAETVTVEFKSGFYSGMGIGEGMAMSAFSNNCFNDPVKQPEGDMVTTAKFANESALLAVAGDRKTGNNDTYNTYLCYDSDGIGNIGEKTKKINSDIGMAEWDHYRFVIDMKNGSYKLYINDSPVGGKYALNRNLVLRAIQSFAFTNPCDDFKIYSGIDSDFAEGLSDFECDTEHFQNGRPVYGYYRGGELESRVQIRNNSSSDMSFASITALYKDNTLICADLASDVASENETITLSSTINVTDYASTTVKTFLMQGLDTLKPYGSPDVLKGKTDTEDYTVFLIGDSVCQSYGEESYPLQGWGYFMQDKFDSHAVVKNYAVSGWATSQYLEQWEVSQSYNKYLWRNVLPQIKEGDYVIVSLGINDNSSNGYGTTKKQFIENLKRIASDAMKKGAEVIFVTPTIATGPEGGNSFGNSWGNRGEYVRQAASESGLYCIDLGEYCTEFYTSLMHEYNSEAGLAPDDSYGYNKVCYRFNIFRTNLLQPESEGGFGYTEETIENCLVYHVRKNGRGYDGTHMNVRGAEEIAGIICEFLKKSGLPIANNLK